MGDQDPAAFRVDRPAEADADSDEVLHRALRFCQRLVDDRRNLLADAGAAPGGIDGAARERDELAVSRPDPGLQLGAADFDSDGQAHASVGARLSALNLWYRMSSR